MKTTTPADATSATSTAQPADKPTKHPGLLNKRQLAEISYTGTIYALANDPAFFPQIQDDQVITPDFMTKLGADLTGMAQYTGNAANAVLDAEDETGDEEIAKNILIEKIHFIQSKAKLKYAIGSPVLGEYAVGSRFTISRPALETAGGNVLNKLKGDTLPKVTAQHATDLGAALNNYKNTKVTQQGGKGDITTLKTQLAAQVDSLAERRHKLQVAVDGDFPCTDPANAGVRRKFDLPLDRPLSQ